MFNCIDKKTLTYQDSPPWLPTTFKTLLFRQQSTLGKIGKEEPWTLEIISYWSDKLSSILDYFTFEPQKKSILPVQRKRQVLFVYHVLESPHVAEFRSPHVPASHVPVSLLVTAPARRKFDRSNLQSVRTLSVDRPLFRALKAMQFTIRNYREKKSRSRCKKLWSRL